MTTGDDNATYRRNPMAFDLIREDEAATAEREARLLALINPNPIDVKAFLRLPLTQANVAEHDFLQALDDAVREYFGSVLNALPDAEENGAKMEEAVNDIAAYIYRRMGVLMPKELEEQIAGR